MAQIKIDGVYVDVEGFAKHHEVIAAFAAGARIQMRKPGAKGGLGKWTCASAPLWLADWEYRVQPGPEYRLSGVQTLELQCQWERDDALNVHVNFSEGLLIVSAGTELIALSPQQAVQLRDYLTSVLKEVPAA